MPIPRVLVASFAAALALSGLAAAPAGSAARGDEDVALSLALGESASVTEAPGAAVNLGHFAGTDETYPCDGPEVQGCWTILVEVTNPFEAGDGDKRGRDKATLDLALGWTGVGEPALKVYESDAAGGRGALVGGSDELGTTSEAASVAVATAEGDEVRHYVVDVFFHAFAGSWTLDLAFA